MKCLCFFTLVILFVFSYRAQSQTGETGKHQSFQVGGNSISLPSPGKNFVEIGYAYRGKMEVFVPSVNHLICAFIQKEDLQRLEKGEEVDMKFYALVEILKDVESIDCNQSDFIEMVNGAKNEFGGQAKSSFKDCEEELNQRMKSLNLDSIQLSAPVQLGSFFSKSDAYGFGMVFEMKQAEKSLMMAGCSILIRVKQRLLYAYLYARFKDTETVKWLGYTSEKWADAILKANK